MLAFDSNLGRNVGYLESKSDEPWWGEVMRNTNKESSFKVTIQLDIMVDEDEHEKRRHLGERCSSI